MTTYTISGPTIDPDDSAALTGLWTVRAFDACGCSNPGELVNDLNRDASLYVSPGREVSLTLTETLGQQLYWAFFESSDRTRTLGPFLFTLTTDRTWVDVIANPAPNPGGGVSGDSTPDFYKFAVSGGFVIGDPQAVSTITAQADYPAPSAKFTIDAGTKLVCAESGIYQITYGFSPSWTDLTVTQPGHVSVESTLGINDQDKSPAGNYYPNAPTYFPADPGVAFQGQRLEMTFAQPLDVNDYVEILFQAKLRTGDIAGTALIAQTVLLLTRMGDLS